MATKSSADGLALGRKRVSAGSGGRPSARGAKTHAQARRLFFGASVCVGLAAAGCSSSTTTSTSGGSGGGSGAGSTTSSILRRTSTSSGSGSGGTTGASTGTGTSGAITCAPACKSPTPVCNAQALCVQCQAASDCAAYPALPYCVTDSTNNRFDDCVACLTDANCDGGICDPTSLTCSAPSSDCRVGDAGCTTPNLTVCDPSSGACVQCVTSSQCPQALPVCYQDQCQGCATDSQCPADAGLPYCNLEGACEPCKTNADCHDGGTCNFPNPGTCS